jgi:hypothetical protein
MCELAGWVQHPTIEYFGATPDRLVGTDGLVEAKCPTTVTYVEWRKAGVIPEKHIPQLLGQLACTRRRWVDFVAFDPRIQDQKLLIFVRRFEPEQKQIEELEAKVQEFLQMVEKTFRAFVEN